MRLWRYNPIIGDWRLMRGCTMANAQAWLEIFQRDEPAAVFRLAARRPRGKP